MRQGWLVDMSEATKVTSPPVLADKPRLVSVPPLLITLRDYLQTVLQPLLRTMFEKIDDHFFELAEKAQIDAEQKIYFTAKKEVRSKRRAIEASYLSVMSEVFHLVPEATTADQQSDTEKILSNISIDDPLFRVLVVFDAMADKAATRVQPMLSKVTEQINALLPEYTLDKYNSPLSIYTLTEFFLASCSCLNVEAEEKIIILNMFDKYVLSECEQILNGVHRLLLEGEISSLASVKQSVENAKEANRQKNTKKSKNNKIQDYQAQKNTLLDELFRLQVVCLVDIADKDVRDMADLVKTTTSELAINDELLLGELQQAINLMRMLTSFMLSESDSDDLAQWINQLYIPLLKAALIDVTVMSSEGHAVRRLLNEIAKTAIDVKADSVAEEDLYRRHIVQLIDRISKEFDRDLSIFPELLVDFKVVIDDERKRQAIISSRLNEGKTSAARSEKAQSMVDKTIARITKNKQVPIEAMDFLNSSWRLVLMLAYLKEGEKSPEWVEALQTAEVLIDSVLPSSQNDFFGRLPELLNGLQVGMTGAGFTPAEVASFFAELESLHLQHYQPARKRAAQRLSLKPTLLPLEVVSEFTEELSTELTSSDDMIDSTSLQSITEQISEKTNTLEDKREQAKQCVSELKADMWLEFYADADQKKRIKIAAILQPTHKFIFVDRDGKKIFEKTNDEMIDAIEQGIIRLLDANSLFGRALSVKQKQ